ncbi:polysaccharide pyruvyl transferase family protein [Marinobacterium mangrovicola]|uniref:Polysaccharide pyruvyl transferase n=1 Tax=Marinobacterium mangrovicola TaxID=1476959 RepID=A0A4R1GMN1_9GAMM|nr:polysaccharide pyruvyl transferase family protein [Marinobacterium mangrovicola]TCK07539.1 polysaccharide pyruvyl transferase [Marinobacterium mangrovicola]
MDVAILTQPLGHNYGGLLQAYALQFVLGTYKVNYITIDRLKNECSAFETIKHRLRETKEIVRGRRKYFFSNKRKNLVLKELIRFKKERIHLSIPITSESGLRDYFKNRNFHAVIVGSDQVWRPRYSPSILNFFLDFLDDIDCNAKKVSYAASFGVDCWEYDVNLSLRCKELLENFNAVSVREKSAIELCSEYLSKHSTLVLDPTLLLDPDDYLSLVPEAKASREYDIVSYILDSSDVKYGVEEFIANKLNASIYSLKPDSDPNHISMVDTENYPWPSVEEWINAFANSRFILTDSFHGTVFAIIFNKPFIALGNVDRGLSRFQSLLSLFGLENRLVTDVSDVSERLLSTDPDWAFVNQQREELKEQSLSFLLESIGAIRDE